MGTICCLDSRGQCLKPHIYWVCITKISLLMSSMKLPAIFAHNHAEYMNTLPEPRGRTLQLHVCFNGTTILDLCYSLSTHLFRCTYTLLSLLPLSGLLHCKTGAASTVWQNKIKVLHVMNVGTQTLKNVKGFRFSRQ
jgi:hypothetical protein